MGSPNEERKVNELLKKLQAQKADKGRSPNDGSKRQAEQVGAKFREAAYQADLALFRGLEFFPSVSLRLSYPFSGLGRHPPLPGFSVVARNSTKR